MLVGARLGRIALPTCGDPVHGCSMDAGRATSTGTRTTREAAGKRQASAVCSNAGDGGARITDYTRNRMRQRRIPEVVVLQVFDDPDGVHPTDIHHVPDREVRWRRYDDQVVEIVVDLIDDTIVSAWTTRVEA